MKKAATVSANSRTPRPKISLDAFISSVAAANPLPGGGSVAALAGVMAAALGEMMAGLTEGRQRFAAVDRKVKKMHEKLSGARGELQLLIHEDVEAYRSLLKAVHLPRETGTQKAFRADAVEKSIHGATETPLRTIRAVYAILECLKVLIEIGNPNARCDAAVGAHLAYASLQGARYNVLINIRSIKDRVLARRCRAEASDLQARGRKLLRGIDRLAKIR